MSEWATWNGVRQDDWLAIADTVFENFATKRPLWLLSGELGTGKTSFVKALGTLILPEAIIQSPTFSLIQQYSNQQITVYHADLYRLKKITEAYDIGLIELMDSGALLLIEWPELILPLVPASMAVWLKFSGTEDPETRHCSLWIPTEADFG